MSCIQNSCIGTPSPCKQVITSLTGVLVITAIVLAVIGLTAAPGGPFNAIVQFGLTNNGILLGTSVFALILDLAWIGLLCRKRDHQGGSENIAVSESVVIEAPITPYNEGGDDHEKSENIDVPEPVITEAPITPDNKGGGELSYSLPKEIWMLIFGYLDPFSLGRNCVVSRDWKILASDEQLWKALYPAIAFGKEKWATYFGDIGEEPPLPRKIHQILDSPCPFWEGKRVGETHILVLIPATVDREKLTLDKLKELIQNPKSGDRATNYAHYDQDTKNEHGDTPIKQSYWVLMTKDVIPGSRRKSYHEQKGLVSQHEGYSLPKAIEAAICLLMEHAVSGTKLYGIDPRTYTRCKELVIGRCPVVVGDFGSRGFCVSYVGCGDDYCDGVGALRKF